MSTIRDRIVTEARSWIGTRWQHQGVCKGVGCDCIGLIGGVAHNVGLSHAWVDGTAQKYKGYGREPVPAALLKACSELLTVIDPRDALRGDILLLRFHAEPQHFAFLSEVSPLRYIIHGYAQARKVVENRVDDLWHSRIVGAYRLPGVA